MENKKELEDLHKKSLERIDDLIKKNSNLKADHREKLDQAKAHWQNSWNSLMDLMVYLEHIEL